MSRSRPLPTAPDHELHDPLLVAQLTAGDGLDPARQAEGQLWVTTCGACAELAADLRSISGAVAWEPQPPRRRDYRIDAEQAARLRGNVVTRFLGGLSLPQARAFRPAAAGIMSLGLAFVVVAYAWPDDGPVQLSSAPALVPAAVESVPAEPPDAAVGFAAEDAAESRASQKSAAERASGAELEAAAEAPEPMAGAALEEGLADDALMLEADAAPAADAAVLPEDDAEILSDVDAMQRGGGYLLADATPGSEVDLSDSAENVEAAPAEFDEATSAEVAGVTESDDGLDLGELLFAAGLVLALTGGFLLMLAWLARRASDPLLR